MSNVLTDLYSMFVFSCIYERKVKQNDISINSDCFPLIENLVLCDKIVLESNGVKHHGLQNVCSQFPDAITYIEDINLYEKNTNEETQFVGNDFNKRGLVYANLARKHGIYYSPHPIRDKVLSEEITKYIERTATSVIQEFDQRFSETQSGEISNVNVKIPPIVEHVLYFSKAQNISISESINEIRNSKNARMFREHFNALDFELRNLSPRKKIAVYQPIFSEIDKLCSIWEADMDAEVKYRKREIKLAKIPIAGKVLESIGIGNILINDPILFSSSPHLLFINDLYQK